MFLCLINLLLASYSLLLIFHYFMKNSSFFIEHFGQFGIITIAIDVAEDEGASRPRKTHFLAESPCFEHLYFVYPVR